MDETKNGEAGCAWSIPSLAYFIIRPFKRGSEIPNCARFSAFGLLKYFYFYFHYKSESAISAATDGIKELADLWGYEEFTIPDYEKEQKWLYHNFNTALSNPFVASERSGYFDPIPSAFKLDCRA